MSRLDWPPGWDRTPSRARTRTREYDVSLSDAFTRLESTLVRLDATDYSYSFAARQRPHDQRPAAGADPDDPGFVCRWAMTDDQFAVGCDQYVRLRSNVAAVESYLTDKRALVDAPVTTAAPEFENARLSLGGRDDVEANAGLDDTDKTPAEILGVSPEAPDVVVEAAARALKAERHPDNGGTAAAFQRVVDAEAALLEK